MEGSRAYLAEFLGTFALCFVGAGSICTDALTGGGVGLVGIALAHGLVLAVMVTVFMPVSGSHFNPAVSFGYLITGRMTPARLLAYWASQLAGGVVAGLLIVALFSPEVRAQVSSGTPVPDPTLGLFAAVALEALLTFLLVIAVFGTILDDRAPRLGGLAIGLAVAFGVLMGGPLTGAAMNPARTFGPALASGVWDGHLVYWIGPLFGGAAAAALYDRFFLRGRAA